MPKSRPGTTDAIIPGHLAPREDAVRRVNPAEEPGWNSRLAAFSSASVFHGTGWARVLQNTYGFRPCNFTCDDARSVLPVMEVDSWLTGKRGVSLPFTDECTPLCNERTSWDRLWHEALNYAQVRGWRYLECRGGRSLFRGAPASTSFFGHRLALDGDRQARLARLDSSVRRAVRKAEQNGLKIEVSQGMDAIRIFYRLLCRTRKKHGVPPQPFSFFQNIQRHIMAEDQGWIVLAWHGRLPVAGAVFFRSGTTVVYKYSASNEAWQHLRPNNLVLWHAINWFGRQGFAQLDFGRTSLANEGLRRFKLGWGSEERRIDYVRYDLRSRSFVTARDQASGWYSRIFRILPLILSRLAGAAFYRHAA